MDEKWKKSGSELAEELTVELRRQARSGFDAAALLANRRLVAIARQLGIGDDEAKSVLMLRDALDRAVRALPEVEGRAGALLLGLDPRSRGQNLSERRAHAADVLSIGPESFRKHREGLLLAQVASNLVLSAAGHPAASDHSRKWGTSNPIDPRRVLLIHDRNTQAAEGVCRFLKALGLTPVSLMEGVHETGLPLSELPDSLRAAIEVAQAVVVVLAPQAGSDSLELGEPRHPSPNLLFEAGIALGAAPTRTVIVNAGATDLPSDLAGGRILTVRNSPACRNAFKRELEMAGCETSPPDDSWLTGDFIAVTKTASAIVNEDLQALRVQAVAEVGRRALHEIEHLLRLEQQLSEAAPSASERLRAVADMAARELAQVVVDASRTSQNAELTAAPEQQ